MITPSAEKSVLELPVVGTWFKHFENSLAVSQNVKYVPTIYAALLSACPREMKAGVHIRTCVCSSVGESRHDATWVEPDHAKVHPLRLHGCGIPKCALVCSDRKQTSGRSGRGGVPAGRGVSADGGVSVT